MNIEDGLPNTQSESELLNLMIDDAKELLGDDLNDNDVSAIRFFYTPVARKFQELQESIGLVLTANQIDNAEGDSLDLLTSLIGVRREAAQRAFGEVTFSRSEPSTVRDYTIPVGTRVRTDGSQSINFETTEFATLTEGDTEVTVPVEAVNAGTTGNVGSNTITVIRDNISGIESVVNYSQTSGGTAEETDEELRARAKLELGEGSRATPQALISAVNRSDENVRSVNIFLRHKNDLLQTGTDHPGFELVIDGGDEDTIAQTIMDHKAAGDISYAGFNGEAIEEPVSTRISNGQTFDIEFSRPEPVEIYVSASFQTSEDYKGDSAVRKAITEYIGGEDSIGNTIRGELGVSDNVLHGEVEFAMRTVDGVYDVDELFIDIEEDPTSTDNITIEDGKIARTSANESFIDLTVN